MQTPVGKLSYARLKIYAGIHDGYAGSVPVTQSLKFYNKVLRDLGVDDPDQMIAPEDMLYMLETRLSPTEDNDFGFIGDRKIHYRRSYGNVQVLIFEGGHEPLRDALLQEIQE